MMSIKDGPAFQKTVHTPMSDPSFLGRELEIGERTVQQLAELVVFQNHHHKTKVLDIAQQHRSWSFICFNIFITNNK